jgi:tetratricopeptide (TPR) repeat protein
MLKFSSMMTTTLWMGSNLVLTIQRFRFRALCLAGLLSTCLGSPGWANDRLDSALEAIEQEFRGSTSGMSSLDYADMQMVYAQIRDRDFEAAHSSLEQLIRTYPERPELSLLMGQVHLLEFNPEDALRAFQDAESKAAKEPYKEQFTPSQHLEVRVGMSQAHTQLGNYSAALQVLSDAPLDAAQLSATDKETWYLSKAKAAYNNKDLDSVYIYLQQALSAGKSPAVLDFEQQVKGKLAEHKYQQGLAAYRREHFGEALKSLRIAMDLNPDNIDYVRLMNDTHSRFVDEVRIRVQKMRPLLRQSLEDMRWALEVDDYDQVYRQYQKLLQNPDVDFFIGNNYRGYLPDEMRSSLVFIETTLRGRGYRVAS